jgi:Holliday junction resolvase RusA-like endonuclease
VRFSVKKGQKSSKKVFKSVRLKKLSTPQNEWFRRGRILKCYSKKSKKCYQKNAKLINKEKKPKKELEKPVNTENMYGI